MIGQPFGPHKICHRTNDEFCHFLLILAYSRIAPVKMNVIRRAAGFDMFKMIENRANSN